MTSSPECKKNSKHPLFVHWCLEINSCLDMMSCVVLPPRGVMKTKPTAQIANFVLHASNRVHLRYTCNLKHLFTLPLIFVICANLPFYCMYCGKESNMNMHFHSTFCPQNYKKSFRQESNKVCLDCIQIISLTKSMVFIR